MFSACSGRRPGHWNRGRVLSGYLVLSRRDEQSTLNQPERGGDSKGRRGGGGGLIYFYKKYCYLVLNFLKVR